MKGEEPTISPEMLRSVLESLGPTFVKLGQVLSLRADLVGGPISHELAGLQSNVAPFSYETAQNIIRVELGKEPEEIFRVIEEKPVAAASLSQVHRGILPNGTEVAIKVQRPGIQKTVEQDIQILFRLARLAERYMPELRPYAPLRVVREFADWTRAELDFTAEGHNADRFRFIFSDNPHINVPRIYWEQSSRRVLTMDFVRGVKADDLAGLQRLQVDPKNLALQGVHAMFHQFFIEGIFHADPHPGNFFALKNDVLCLHDFGMVGTLDRRQRHALLRCVLMFMNRDIDGFVRHFLKLAIIDDQSDISRYERDLTLILSELYYSAENTSVAWAFFRAINKGARHHLRFPADLALFGKAMITTEAMGQILYPEFQFEEELRPFVRDVIQSYMKKFARSWEGSLIESLDLLDNLPDRIRNILETAERGEVRVKIAPEKLTSLSNKQPDWKLPLLGGFLFVALLLTGILLYWEDIGDMSDLSPASLGVGITGVLFLWFLWKFRKLNTK